MLIYTSICKYITIYILNIYCILICIVHILAVNRLHTVAYIPVHKYSTIITAYCVYYYPGNAIAPTADSSSTHHKTTSGMHRCDGLGYHVA